MFYQSIVAVLFQGQDGVIFDGGTYIYVNIYLFSFSTASLIQNQGIYEKLRN